MLERNGGERRAIQRGPRVEAGDIGHEVPCFPGKGVLTSLYVSAAIIARIIRGLGPIRFEACQSASIYQSWGG